MLFVVLAAVLSWLIDLATLRWRSDRAVGLEILLLRRQLAPLQRAQPRPLRLTRWEKLGLAVLMSLIRALPSATLSRVQGSLLLVTPATVLRWHRELVRRTWTVFPQCSPGRPPIVESLFLKTIFVLFYIEVRARKVYLAGCTPHPTATWVTQQARKLSWYLQDGTVPVRVLIHDRDGKCPPGCDAVFRSEGLEIARMPPRCPQANGVAERWIRSARRECLNHLLIVNEWHLYRVLSEHVKYYNERSPHQGLGQRCPVPLARGPGQGPIERREVLGGLLHDYDRQTA
jgi:hypothetical protein